MKIARLVAPYKIEMEDVEIPKPTTDGGLAELIVLPESLLVKLPDGCSLDAGVFVEPTTVAVDESQAAGRMKVVVDL